LMWLRRVAARTLGVMTSTDLSTIFTWQQFFTNSWFPFCSAWALH